MTEVFTDDELDKLQAAGAVLSPRGETLLLRAVATLMAADDVLEAVGSAKPVVRYSEGPAPLIQEQYAAPERVGANDTELLDMWRSLGVLNRHETLDPL